MKVNVVIQPDTPIGGLLVELLTSPTPIFSKIWIVSAFANRRAVRHLVPHILMAKSHGAEIRVVVGIDHRSTSVEALRELSFLNIAAYVVHNKKPGHTFHPKIFLFEAPGVKAELLIGSNNLTEGGLYTNYEASVRMGFNLPEDEAEYKAIKQSLEEYLNPSGPIVQALTDDLIRVLIERGDVLYEKQVRETRKRLAASVKRKRGSVPPSPFGSVSLKRPPKLPELPKPRRPKKALRPGAGKASPIDHGGLLWRKEKLPRSDVQRQPGNPTGGLRLVQADWEVGGKTIDQTSYFRTDVFGHLKWSRGVLQPRAREAVKVPVDVHILGKGYGLHELTISHKPSGEAGQGNYTTMLHWGDLGDTIRELNLVGKTFCLYAPPPGQAEPFAIEIT